jgi:DNA modification methylase
MGVGTTGLVAEKLGRRWVGIELGENNCKMAVERIKNKFGIFPLF